VQAATKHETRSSSLTSASHRPSAATFQKGVSTDLWSSSLFLYILYYLPRRQDELAVELREAQSRARKAYWGARRGGWQHRGGSMAAQLAYAGQDFLPLFNHVAAIAGAGGCASSAPWRKNETVVA